MPLDPQVAAHYKGKKFNSALGIAPIEQVRAAVDFFYNDSVILVDLPEVKNLEIPAVDLSDSSCEPVNKESNNFNIPIRVYYPIKEEEISSPLPVMLYFHGGAYAIHNIASHDNLCRKLAKECNCIVISTEYRLAPEHKHPAQIEDAISVLQWTIQNANRIGADSNKIITAGDSAGAAISASLCLYAKRHNINNIVLQILYYGVFGCVPVEETESFKLFSNGDYVLPADMIRESNKLILPEKLGTDELSSLEYLEAGRADDLKMNTASLIITAEYDPLRDDGKAFADKMESCGNEMTYIQMDGMMHGFMLLWDKFDRSSEVFEATKEALLTSTAK